MVIREPDAGFCSECTGRTINKSAYAGANLQLVMLISKWDWLCRVLCLVLHIFFNRQAVGNAAGERHFIGVLEFAAKGYAAGDGSDLNGIALQLLLNIINGGIALDVGVQGRNELFCFFPGNALYKRFYG